MSVNDILKSRREELGLTMKELADSVGVSESTISRWESGDIANMRRDKIVALAKALSISPSVIMEWDDGKRYYTNEETARLAQEAFEDSNMRILLSAKRDLRPDDFKMVVDMVKRFKEMNPNG